MTCEDLYDKGEASGITVCSSESYGKVLNVCTNLASECVRIRDNAKVVRRVCTIVRLHRKLSKLQV